MNQNQGGNIQKQGSFRKSIKWPKTYQQDADDTHPVALCSLRDARPPQPSGEGWFAVNRILIEHHFLLIFGNDAGPTGFFREEFPESGGC